METEDDKSIDDLLSKICHPVKLSKAANGEGPLFSRLVYKYKSNIYWPFKYWFFETLYDEWVREKCRLQGILPSSFLVKDWWYRNVSAQLFPRNKWATRIIPKTYSDPSYLISEFLFASVIQMVEGEKCFESIDYSNGTDSHINFAKGLKECYIWAKYGRKDYDKLIDKAYPPICTDFNNLNEYFNLDSTQKGYDLVNHLESKKQNIDSKWLRWVVDNREHFWT